MKTKDLLFSISIAIISFSTFVQAQNPGWSLPPKYIPNFPGLAVPLPSAYTQNNASNMQLDANGDILFYIIDNSIIDGDGDAIGNLKSFYETSHIFPNVCMELANTSEILIVPDPASCSRYFILTSAQTTHACQGSNPFPNQAEPFVAILDFDLPRPNNSSKFGAITSVERLEDLSSMPPFEYSWTGTDISGGVLFAASKLKDDGDNKSRYVFVSYYTAAPSKDNGIVRFKIGSNGLEYYGLIPFEVQNADGGSRSEMELIELPNGHFRIACPYGTIYSTHSGKDLTAAIYTAELDASGKVYSGNVNTLYFYRNANNQTDFTYIHGLEFSPDGSKLFITHDISYYHAHPFEYYDFSNPNASDPNGNGIYSLSIGSGSVDEADFQNSQIELATDGKIYLGADERLASLSSPNSPNASNFSDNAIALANYHANYGNYASLTDPILKSYTLPDQIDGMDYESTAPVTYDEVVYTALSSGEWKSGQGNNPWDNINGDVYIKEKLVIPSGKSVTIKNMTFHFAPGAKVVIEQGAKLTIDGGTLSNSRACNNVASYWQGVEVWGTVSKNQFPPLNPAYQGMLKLINGGTIENAVLAAANWHMDHWSETGGVIQSNGGIFRNNTKAIQFLSYQNHLSTTNTSDFSYFRNTDFITDNNFIEGLPQQSRVTLYRVHGIEFTNCHFSNNITSNKTGSSSPNDGIFSLNASFSVGPGCSNPPPVGQPCPTSNLLKSSFKGLKFGVKVSGASSSEAVTILQTDFTDNVWGIKVDEFDNVSINRNNVGIGRAGYFHPFPLYGGTGIGLDNSTGYIVEENTVSSLFTNGLYFGISASNSGEDDNRLYKNTLQDLWFGTYASGINHNSNYQKGLQFLCNGYANNEIAINISGSPQTDGVRFYQGELLSFKTKAAGNTFINNTKDIDNNANSIVYYYKGSNAQPINNSGLISVNPATSANSCPSSFGGLVVMKSSSLDLDSLNDNLEELTNTYNNLNYNYLSLIDEGNTGHLKNQIETNWSDDAWDLRGNLIEKSPYLSEEVLLKAAEQNVLPNAMLLEVLLANPDATRGVHFIDKLNTATNNSFPKFMLNYVKNNWDVKTVRTNLEGQMVAVQFKMSTIRNFIKNLRKSEDEHTYADRLKTVNIGDGISNKIGVMDFYIENKEWNKADSVLQAIEKDKNMQDELELVANFDDYITFRSSLGERNIAQLDASEIGYLQTLADKDGRVAGYAQNILCFFYDTCYEKDLPTGNGENYSKNLTIPTRDKPSIEELMYDITVYPNPADKFASIKWEIYDEIKNCEYKIFDLNGREIQTGGINGNKGEQMIDTRSLRNGVYIINIYNDGEMKMNKKLVVNKGK